MSDDLLTDYAITAAMIQFGGGFVSRLGDLFRHADIINQARLKEAFADYWKTYEELARKKGSRDE